VRLAEEGTWGKGDCEKERLGEDGKKRLGELIM